MVLFRANSFGTFCFRWAVFCFWLASNPVGTVFKNGKFRRRSKPSICFVRWRTSQTSPDLRSDAIYWWQVGLRAAFSSWSLRNLPKAVGPFILGMENFACKVFYFQNSAAVYRKQKVPNAPLNRIWNILVWPSRWFLGISKSTSPPITVYFSVNLCRPIWVIIWWFIVY